MPIGAKLYQSTEAKDEKKADEKKSDSGDDVVEGEVVDK